MLIKVWKNPINSFLLRTITTIETTTIIINITTGMLTLPFFLPLSPVVVLLSTTLGVFTLLFGILPTFIELSKELLEECNNAIY